MKRLLGLALFLVAGAASAQWVPAPLSWAKIAADPVPVSTIQSYTLGYPTIFTGVGDNPCTTGNCVFTLSLAGQNAGTFWGVDFSGVGTPSFIFPNLSDGQCLARSGTTWAGASCSGGGGAPTDAQYWVGAANGSLSAEKDLSALSTGLVINTSGTPSAYAGTSCTNQFPRSLNASGAATCASVANADITNSTIDLTTKVTGALPVANGGTGLASGTSGGIPAYTGSTTITSSAALTSNSPVLGGGAGAVPKVVAGITSDGTSKLTLGVAGTSVGSVGFNNATSGQITLQPTTGALGTVTLTMPATSGTILQSGTAVTVAQGGTGLTSGTSGGIPAYTGSTTVTSSAALTSNSPVLGGGAGAVPKVVAGITSDGTSKVTLGVAGTSVGAVGFNNATSGTVTLQPVTGALGTVTLSLPAATATLATTGTNSWADGVRQTFNPNGTNAGINAGANSSDPSGLTNGDIWYNSTSNTLKARINGSSVALGSGSLATDPLWAAAGDTVYGTGASAASILSAGTSGDYMRTNGAAAPSWVQPFLDTQASAIVNADFVGYDSPGSAIVATAGTVTFGVALASQNQHPGVLRLTTTTNAGKATFQMVQNSNTDQMVIGGGAIIFKTAISIATLATAGDDYTYRVGFCDNDAGNCTDGVWLEYNRATSANWIMSTANAGTRTQTASSTAVATGWKRLQIVINAAGSSADYYIDGVNIGTVSTNMPCTTTCGTIPEMQMLRTASTGTSLTIDHDYFKVVQYFTNTR